VGIVRPSQKGSMIAKRGIATNWGRGGGSVGGTVRSVCRCLWKSI
jgi:hypothetical protein